MKLLHSMMTEFSNPNCSSIGMTWEEHKNSCTIFQKSILVEIYQYSINFLSSFMKEDPKNEQDLKICEISLTLLQMFLNWDFSSVVFMKDGYEKDKDDSIIHVTTNDYWKNIISDINILNLLINVRSFCVKFVVSQKIHFISKYH
jgi:hypothetical protein